MSQKKFSIQPPVLAHRGASIYAPENTMAAFIQAKELGIRWLEFDVMLSADNQLVVIHDETLDRTTDGSGYVCDYPCSELETLDAGLWFGNEFAGETIPLFTDVIQFLNKEDMAANIEIKALPGKEEIAAEKVLEAIHKYWHSEMMPPFISSFSREILYAVREQNPDIWLGLLMNEWFADWRQVSDELQCVSVNVNQEILTLERIKEIKAAKRAVLAYTVDSVARAQTLFSWGVDAVYSNCPDMILEGIQ